MNVLPGAYPPIMPDADDTLALDLDEMDFQLLPEFLVPVRLGNESVEHEISVIG